MPSLGSTDAVLQESQRRLGELVAGAVSAYAGAVSAYEGVDIGQAMAILLARQGAEVLTVDIDE